MLHFSELLYKVDVENICLFYSIFIDYEVCLTQLMYYTVKYDKLTSVYHINLYITCFFK